MKPIFLLFFVLVIANETNSQNSEYYKKYDFEEFLKIKTVDSGYNYIRTIYKKINTDYEYDDNREDVTIRVLLINHGKHNQIEVIPIDSTNFYRRDIVKTLKKVNEKILKKDDEKYITEIKIIYDYEPHKYFLHWRDEIPDIRLFIHKTKYYKTTLH